MDFRKVSDGDGMKEISYDELTRTNKSTHCWICFTRKNRNCAGR